MNRLFRRTTSVAALLLLGAASTARADFNVGYACGGSNFSTCAAVQLSWDYQTQTATLTITNWGNADAIIGTVGLTNLPEGYEWDVDGSTLNGWQPAPPNNLGGDGIIDEVAQVSAPNPRVKNGIEVGESLTFVFQFTGLDQSEMEGVGVGFHALGNGDCSTKVNFNSSGQITNDDGVYTAGCASTVPEPATMGLVTTGLLGLGGAGFLRRRKKV